MPYGIDGLGSKGLEKMAQLSVQLRAEFSDSAELQEQIIKSLDALGYKL